MAHTFSPSTWEEEADRSLWVQGQPDLQSSSSTASSTTERPCLEKQKNKKQICQSQGTSPQGQTKHREGFFQVWTQCGSRLSSITCARRFIIICNFCFSEYNTYFFPFKDLLCVQCSAWMHAYRPEEDTRSHYRWLWATMWLQGIECRMSKRTASECS